MRNELIDSLTRVLATPTVNRSKWRVVTATAATTFWALLGRSLAHPQSALASIDVSKGCLLINQDGTCPPGTTKRPQPGNVPSYNGCGPEGGSIKIPQGYGNADYRPACNGHDLCYEECGTPKSDCDDNFHHGMDDSCAEAYPGPLNSLYRFGCYERSYAYYQAVSQFGDDAWIAGQYKACESAKTRPQFIAIAIKSAMTTSPSV